MNNCDFEPTGLGDEDRLEIACKHCDRPLLVTRQLGTKVTRACEAIRLERFAPPSPPPTAPPPANSARLIRQFTYDLKSFIAAGLPLTPVDERVARDRACAGCDQLHGDGVARWCQACGCYLHAKVRMATATCPKKRWPAGASATTITIDESQARPCAGCPPLSAPAYSASDRVQGYHGGPAKHRLLLKMAHGLGDLVQFSVVLRHLRANYPEWEVHVATHDFCRTMLRELAHETYALGSEPPASEFAIARTLHWWEPDNANARWPSTKSEKCLQQVFGIEPVLDLCGYRLATTPEAAQHAAQFAASIGGPFVLVHYQGSSSRGNKDIDEHAMRRVLDLLVARGLTPVLIDFDYHSGLIDRPGVRHAQPGHRMWRKDSASVLLSLAGWATFCIGIDSGPGHVFAASGTPTAQIWLKHHPVHYAGLADSVTHIVPSEHPAYIRGDREAGLGFFLRHYRFRVADQNYRSCLAGMIEALLPSAAA